MISNKELRKKILESAIHGCLVKNKLELKCEKVDMEEPCNDLPFDIPNNWIWIKLKYIAKVISGTSYDKVHISDKGIRIIRGGNIVDDNFVIKADDIFVSNEYYSDEKQLIENDIILVASTGSMDAIGKAAIIKENIDNAQIGAFLRIVRVKKEYSKYVGYIFMSDYYRNIIRELVKGMAINNIKNGYLNEMLIPLPPLEEQEKIVDKIDKLFELIDKKEKNDLEKNKLKTLLREKVLKDCVYKKVSDDVELWNTKKFKDIFDIINGFTPLRTNKDFWDNGTIPWFTVDDIKVQGHIIDKTLQYITEKAIGKNTKRLIPKGTTLLCCTSATIGNYAFANIDLTTNQQWNGLVVKEQYKNEIYSKYVYYFVQTLKKQMLIDGNSTTFPFISVKKLEDYKIEYPSIELQREIVEKIEQCFELIEQL